MASREPSEGDVGFLMKTMWERDPRKRRVKPVDRHLIQLDFGLDSSEDDSDFNMDDNEDSEGTDTTSGDGGENDDSEDESEADEDENEAENDNEAEDATLKQLIDKARQSMSEMVWSPGKLKVQICCVCLGEDSNEENEIVGCDCCGVLVHESCYGIDDNTSEAGSTASSTSQEPWFCDPCKAGVTSPCCELCPNSGGIFTETVTGRWVHLICAMYIPEVVFMDIDRLSPVTLFEMPYSKWGAKECCLCEDARFSQTGVCVECDAGLCRSFFHATCGQREGLLTEAMGDEEIADPYFAYCKVHSEKLAVRHRKRNYLATQSHSRQFRENSGLDVTSKMRIERKLQNHKTKFLANHGKKAPTGWMPTEKTPRYLTSSPYVVKQMLRKAELLGISIPGPVTQKVENRKKVHSATFSAEFVNYFLERNVKMASMKGHFKEMLSQHDQLMSQENVLRQKYDRLSSEVKQLREQALNMRHSGERLWSLVGEASGWKIPPVPSAFRSPRKPSRSSPKDSSKMERARSPQSVMHSCGLCQKNTGQHLQVCCDLCKNHYHIGCLDPPLTRIPKKTKLQGWQCSECAGSSSDGPEPHVHPDAPMRLRETITEPKKWTPLLDVFKKTTKEKKSKSKARKKLLPERKNSSDIELIELEDNENTVLPPKRKKYTPKKPQIEEVAECATCHESGSRTDLVRCDECAAWYHFRCLDPPLKKTPKRRGYAWLCFRCDPSDDHEEESDVEKDSPRSESLAIKEIDLEGTELDCDGSEGQGKIEQSETVSLECDEECIE